MLATSLLATGRLARSQVVLALALAPNGSLLRPALFRRPTARMASRLGAGGFLAGRSAQASGREVNKRSAICDLRSANSELRMLTLIIFAQ